MSHLTINRPYSYDVGLFGHIDGAVVRNVGLVGGSVIGDSFVGGLVGESTHQSVVENVFNTGSVQGYGTVGGLVGRNFDGSTIKNAYATGDVTGAQNSTYKHQARVGFPIGAQPDSVDKRNDVEAWLNLSKRF